MFYLLKKHKKAALINAAFFIYTSVQAKLLPQSLENVRARASTLLLQKQKKQALQVVSEFIKNETNRSQIVEATDFLATIAQTFVTKESQEAYETSLNLTVENPKESLQLADQCLQAEPQNSDCLVQKLRLAFRRKNNSDIEVGFLQIKEVVPGSKIENWVGLQLKKKDPDFKNKIIIKRLTDKPSEEAFVLSTLELDRAFIAKNFSRAKEVIQYLEKNFSDWPDIIYYKQKIEIESSEDKILHSTDANTQYVAKCKSLSKSIARKYRYDFELCIRG